MGNDTGDDKMLYRRRSGNRNTENPNTDKDEQGLNLKRSKQNETIPKIRNEGKE